MHKYIYICYIYKHLYIYIYMYIFTYKYIYKSGNVVEGNQKALFSILTTLECRRGCYSFPWIATHYP